VGTHYTPQAQLRAFEDSGRPGMIWTHFRDKPPRLLPIANVAQSPGYYDPETERKLNDWIEAPANPILTKLRSDQAIGPEEWERVVIYVATMLKRVPRSRERVRAIAATQLDHTITKMRMLFRGLAARGWIDFGQLFVKLAEIDEVERKFREKLPDEVIAQIESPWPLRSMLWALTRMRWRVLAADPSESFLTSDNPAVFFECWGLGTEPAELCFPLSPTRCLYGTNQAMRDAHLLVVQLSAEWTREVAARVASAATRLAFSHQKLQVPKSLMDVKTENLHRFVWAAA
jgi:hypothetical protein